MPFVVGNRDWEKIHQREFKRMEGLDSYVQRKKERSDNLTQSISKMRLLTQNCRFTVDSAKQYRTPPSILKVRPTECSGQD